MWAGIFFDFATFDVSGSVITNPAGPALKASSLTTSTGRAPDCSCPRLGLRSASQISPRIGSAMPASPVDPFRLPDINAQS
jgi:hypothetical protein